MCPVNFTEASDYMQQAALDCTRSYYKCELTQAVNKVIAQDIISPIDSPPFDASAMDGIAFAAADAQKKMLISQVVFAGMNPLPLAKNTAVRIFTGAPLPQGADTVIPQENCTIEKERVTINQQITHGSWVRKRGKDAISGMVVVPAGTKLSPLHMSVCAGLGVTEVYVYEPIKVQIITTGDEVIHPSEKLESGKIYNSSAPFLINILTSWQCQVNHCHIADDADALEKAIKEAAYKNDLIITTGGASVGDADHLMSVVKRIADLFFWGINMQPGRPVLFARTHQKGAFIYGLPGNPVSVLVGICVLVRPFIRHLQKDIYSKINYYTAESCFKTTPNQREEFRRVCVVQENQKTCLYDLYSQESHMLVANLQANALAIIPSNTEVNHGDKLRYVLLTECLAC